MNRQVNAIAGRLSLRAAAARVARDSGSRRRDRAAGKGRRPRRRTGSDPERVPARHGLRARLSVAVLRAGDRRGQDAADGRVHQLPLPRRTASTLLRARAESHDLQQADRRLHAEHAEVRLQGNRGVRDEPPEIITGDNYERARRATLFDQPVRLQDQYLQHLEDQSEVRGGKSPRIKRLSEYIGESYFEYLSSLTTLSCSWTNRIATAPSAGVRAINELKPILGLELTATPYVETGAQGRCRSRM